MKATAYLFQAALVGMWWAGLVCSDSFFRAFQFDGVPAVAFWSFLLPDLALIAGLSIARAYRGGKVLETVILGAFGYASLYCCNATLLTGSGYLPTGLMLLGLGYNAFLCFDDAVFRTSSSGVRWNATKTAIHIVCVWALTLFVAPCLILDAFDALAAPRLGTSLWVGLVLFSACGALGLTSAYYMVRHGDGTPWPYDQANQLVVNGPYRYVRNPMAVAGIGQGVAVAIVMQSFAVLAYAALGAIVWHVVVRPVEEDDLIKRFGGAYAEYRDRVPLWLPSLH